MIQNMEPPVVARGDFAETFACMAKGHCMSKPSSKIVFGEQYPKGHEALLEFTMLVP